MLTTTAQPQIEQLAARPELIPIVATWIYNEWWTTVPGASVETLTARLQSHLVHDQIPLTLVASLGDRPVGTATLLGHDVGTDEWPELSPWLAAVYVVPEYRRRGVGGALVNAAVERATALRVGVLYLLTSAREGFYAHLGWQVRERKADSILMSKRTGCSVLP